MHFGLFNLMSLRDDGSTAAQVLSDTMAMVELAEQVGFEIAWFAEHHFSNYCICPSPLMMAAHAASRTERIRLGAAVVVMPLYHPLRMVQEIALLDLQSAGRAVIGIGSGYQKYEFDRYGQSLDERTEVMLEAWDIMERALIDGEVAYQGQHFQLPHSPMIIQPVQQPMPQVYVTGMAPPVLQRCAKSGYTPFVTGGFRGYGLVRQLRGVIDKAYRAAEVDPLTSPFAVQTYVHVTDSKDEARDFAERARYIGRIVAQMRAGDPVLDGAYIKAPEAPDEPSLDEIIDNLIVGDPQHCAERVIHHIRSLGVTHFNCFMQVGGLPRDRALKSLERFGTEVIPLVERELGPLAQLGPVRDPEFALAGQ